MKDIIEFENQYYILASSSLADSRAQTLKDNDTFAIFDPHGDLNPYGGNGEQGLYHKGTRYLNYLQLFLNNKRPLLLSSAVESNNLTLGVNLANPDFSEEQHILLSRDNLHIHSNTFLWNSTLYREFRLKNYDLNPLYFELNFYYSADFKDIFEIRGLQRERRGNYQEAILTENEIILGYKGLDNIFRKTHICFNPAPSSLNSNQSNFQLKMASQEEIVIYLTVCCEDQENLKKSNYNSALQAKIEANSHQIPNIYASNEQFNDWINRSTSDLQMMLSNTSHGNYPYAGVPWFSTAFGRDGLITAFECLWLQPEISKGVLSFLAHYQAQSNIPEQDAEKGKILHEMRQGEMANLKEIPFGLYYGSIDSTPLFIMLASAYYERTGDLEFIKNLWPNLKNALDWLSSYGNDFIRYSKQSSDGLVQQGWKDSHDSIFTEKGLVLKGAIALCEVQAYAYASKKGMALLAQELGEDELNQKLLKEAKEFKEKFDKAFWLPELNTYALALDENNNPCKVKTSNAGHVLLSGLASEERAKQLAKTLFHPSSFSGWGIRTLAENEIKYNPMSYHNGSVWPHDTALIAYGLAKYNLKSEAALLLQGLFEASIFVELHRLPELFCGFSKIDGKAPTLYPVACSPQAWATGAVFLLLQACLGISFNCGQNQIPQIIFTKPLLPEFLPEVKISNLKIGEASLDLILRRHSEQDVGVNILRREGNIEVKILK